jgi:hypothetical protein
MQFKVLFSDKKVEKNANLCKCMQLDVPFSEKKVESAPKADHSNSLGVNNI